MTSLQYSYPNVNPLRKGWCDLLNHYKWDWFTTLTFRDFPKTYTAINRAKRFLRAIQDKERCKIGYFMAMEYTKLGCPHFHTLMGNLEGVRYTPWFRWWFSRYGGARFKMYDSKKGATHYLTKYVCKDIGWYELKGVDKLSTFDKLTKPIDMKEV